MALIELDRVSKTYARGGETIYALREVTFEMETGEFLAVMGPSGSGKSTLMNVLGCLDTPDAGTYRLNGRDTSRLSENELADIRNRTVGFVFQSFNLLPRLSVYENVELPLLYRGTARKERERLVTEALHAVDLWPRRSHKPSELSGGQQQRAAIARALAGDPPLLLADEPTGSLDTATGQDILALLKSLHGQGRTILMITHDPAVAQQAERIVRIMDGRLVPSLG